MAIEKLIKVTYHDFKLNEIIDPEKFDQNNKDLVEKIDEIVDTVNSQETDLEEINIEIEAVSIERKNPDDDRIFTLIEFRRPDGTLFKTSQLNGTSPYTSRTVKYYDKNENLVQTVEYSITYSNDEVVSEVIISA